MIYYNYNEFNYLEIFFLVQGIVGQFICIKFIFDLSNQIDYLVSENQKYFEKNVVLRKKILELETKK